MNAIEDSKTRENGWETLMYSDEIDNKDFKSSEKASAEKSLVQTVEETQEEL